jgi:hypothetical protein
MIAPISNTLTTVPCWKSLRPRSCLMKSSAPEMTPVSYPNMKLPSAIKNP